MRGAAELCRVEGLAFVLIVAESLGGFHPVAIEQLKRIASALARHTAQEESEAIHHTASPLIIHFSHLPLYVHLLARNVLRQQGRGNGGAISVLSTPKTWCDLRAIHTKSWCE